MIRQFAKHHNKIQFFGYEIANMVLVAQQLWQADGHGYGLNAETLGALSFLLGSGLIWGFHPKKRPFLLFYGGLSLALGGIFFALAGYLLTGLSVILASLETARGGLGFITQLIQTQRLKGTQLPISLLVHQKIANALLGWYCKLVDLFVNLYPDTGQFINERPFITSTLIKAPLRFEFIGKKLLLGDWIGALVGLSWLLLGDLALAFNDPQLQAHAKQQPTQPVID